MTQDTKNQVPFQNTLAFKVLVFTAITGFVLYSAWEKYQQQSVSVTTEVASEKNQTSALPRPKEKITSEVTSSLEKLQPLEKAASENPTVKTIEKVDLIPTKTVAKASPVPTTVPQQQTKKNSGIRTKIQNQSIRDLDGDIVFKGEIDLSKTIARIQNDEVLEEFRHDGITFENREGRLPRQSPGYYREWVHATPKLRGPGPQRVISGKKGEFWYTPNHYSSFIKLNE
jgi:guanyl-specific ribonuclease Sa